MDTVENTSLGPGLVAFIIVVLLGLATVLLWFSMVKQIRKIPPTFDDEPDAAGPEAAEPEAADPEAAEPDRPAADDQAPPTEPPAAAPEA